MRELLKAFTASAFLAVMIVGCDGAEPASETSGSVADLSECCQSAMELVAQMPACCRTGISTAGALTGCCATGMLDATPDADRSDCCRKGKALLDQFKPCCKETTLTGKPSGCCEAMPAALVAQAAK